MQLSHRHEGILIDGAASSKYWGMTKEELKTRVQTRPFRPFKMQVAGDGDYKVDSGDHVSKHPKGRLLSLHLDSGGTAIIDVPLISSIHIKETV